MARPIKKYFNSKSSEVANKTKVVRGLLKELLKGKWKVTDRLTEGEACERFQISRTPVREALIELQGLGLLKLRRNCGALMLGFGSKELANIYAVRALLEGKATRLAASNKDSGELDEQIRTLDELDDGHVRSFHDFIAANCGNMTLAAEISRYNNLIHTMHEIVAEEVEIPDRNSAEEYREILEALKAGKANEAAEAMQCLHDRECGAAIAAMEAFRALPA